MRHLIVVTAALVAFGPSAASVRAQKATEMLIPIGQSPGVSGRLSVVGTIASCDQLKGTMQLTSTDRQSHVAHLTPDTRIWRDRSAAKRPNEVGTFADCRPGRLAEAKFVHEGGTRTLHAEWIKIAVEPGT